MHNGLRWIIMSAHIRCRMRFDCGNNRYNIYVVTHATNHRWYETVYHSYKELLSLFLKIMNKWKPFMFCLIKDKQQSANAL